MMPPRYQKITATGLEVLAIYLSLMIHVVGQHLAGNHVGLVNYTHFVCQSAGALGGAAYVFLRDWRRRCRSDSNATSNRNAQVPRAVGSRNPI
jgi:hypothetical protein